MMDRVTIHLHFQGEEISPHMDIMSEANGSEYCRLYLPRHHEGLVVFLDREQARQVAVAITGALSPPEPEPGLDVAESECGCCQGSGMVYSKGEGHTCPECNGSGICIDPRVRGAEPAGTPL